MQDPGLSTLGDDRTDFEAFQKLGVYLVGSPRLYDALRELDDPDRYDEAERDPHAFLARHGIFIPRDVKLEVSHSSPGCIEMTVFGNRLRVCL